MAVHPSGEQFPISSGGHAATVVEVGGGVREYTVDGRAVLQSYPVDAMCDGAHGTPLIPWPNRLGDGRYRFAGVDHQVALTEPEKHNAIHGFLQWRSWRLVERTTDRVVVGIGLRPLTGYPFSLDVSVEYRLSEAGLTVSMTATNVGEQVCPYGVGQHPYLSPGDGSVDDCTVVLDAATRIVTDRARQSRSGGSWWRALRSTSAVGAGSGTSRSTTRSPTSPGTATDGPGCGCTARTG